MLCFNHPDRQAIGVCRACQRGICKECTADLGHGLACKGKHEADVENLEHIVRQSARIYAVTPKTRNAAPLFFGFMGVVFAVFGFIQGRGVTDFAFLLGVGFIAFAIYSYVYNKRAFAPEK